MTDFTMEKGADGVAVITWDVPGKSMNVLIDGRRDRPERPDRRRAGRRCRQGHRHHQRQEGLCRRDGPEGHRGHEGRERRAGRVRRRDDAAPPAAQDRAGGHGPQDQEGRQADRQRPARHRAWHRAGAAAGHASHLCGRQCQGQDRPARDHGRHLSRRRRHHAPDAQAGRHDGRTLPAGRQAVGPQEGEIGRADRRGRRRPAGRRQGLGAGGQGGRHRQAVGRQGLQDAGRRAVPPGGLHDLRRRLRDGARQDDGRLSGGQGAAVGGL